MPAISTAEAKNRLSELILRASALGQKADLLAQIEAGEVHPAMLAFGLWQDEPGLGNLEADVYSSREQQHKNSV